MKAQKDIDSQTQKTSSTTNKKHVQQTKMFKRLQSVEKFFQLKSKHSSSGQEDQQTQSRYNIFSIIDKNDQDRVRYSQLLKNMFKNKENNAYNKQVFHFDPKIERAVACFLGLAVGDALGSTTQFCKFDKNNRSYIQNDFSDLVRRSKQEGHDREGSVNIWTDDCSMALSLADSLLLNDFKLNPKHSRFMYHMWLHFGLNNGGRPYSIGLGGNISISTYEFKRKQQDYTQQGNRFNNGNGSLMRLAPIPINYLNDQNQGMIAAEQQSRTTHNGDQAKQCCRLLTLIIIRLINRKPQQNWRQVIQKACKDFKTQVKSVSYLARSEQQPQQLYTQYSQRFKNFQMFNKKLSDRNWNWKDPNYTYSPSRADSNPGYVGSYCMDALAMALHTVWHSKTYHEVAIINCNMGGDCDTVGAIAGQIAGAVYGLDPRMLGLYGQMEDAITGRYEVFLKGYKLATHSSVFKK